MTRKRPHKIINFRKNRRYILRIFCFIKRGSVKQCKMESMAAMLLKCRWKWIGNVIKKGENSITTSCSTLDIRRKRNWKNKTKAQNVEGQVKNMNKAWGQLLRSWHKKERSGGPTLLCYIPLALWAGSVTVL